MGTNKKYFSTSDNGAVFCWARRIALGGLIAIACMLGLASARGIQASEILIQGATTVATGLVIPHEAAIESMSGQSISILPTSTTRGLAALAAGKADIAMLAEPLESAAMRVLDKAPGSLDPGLFRDFHVGDAQSQIILNAANPVSSLTREQVAGLFSGQIANWKDIGGPDMDVLAVTEPTSTQHPRIAEAYGFAYGPEVRQVWTAAQTAEIVAEIPGAISYLTTAHQVPERDRIKVVETGIAVPLRLYVAIRKDAGDAVRRVVEATIAVGNP